jgi:hypothetical protein
VECCWSASNNKGKKFMKYIPPKFNKLSEMAAIDVGRLTEDEARVILENIRWPKDRYYRKTKTQ